MIELAKPFGDHVVLQRQKAIRIWGKSDSAWVEISFGGQQVRTEVEDGCWTVLLDPMEACTGQTLTVATAEEQLVLRDVAVGEVWLLGGQSNMEFLMRFERNYANAVGVANPDIRFWDTPKVSYPEHLQDDDFSDYGFWRPCEGEHIKWYSAVGFYFANYISAALRVPVGLIGCDWGGTPACAWADESLLRGTTAQCWLDEYQSALKNLDLQVYAEVYRSLPTYSRKGTDHGPVLPMLMSEKTKEEMFAIRDAMGGMEPPLPMMGPMSPERPSGLYENMVQMIAPYTVRGVLWYQGESDDFHPEAYRDATTAVIQSWRKSWGEELPFFMVMLAPFREWLAVKAMHFPALRRIQRELANELPGLYLTNVMDAGSEWDVHPKNKRPAGERLALLALKNLFSAPVLADAPVPQEVSRCGNKICILFENAGESLELIPCENALRIEVGGAAIMDYELSAKENCLYIQAKEFEQAQEIAIYYNSENFCGCAVRNSAGIPAEPFVITLD